MDNNKIYIRIKEWLVSTLDLNLMARYSLIDLVGYQ